MGAESSEWSRYGLIVRDILLHKAEGPRLDKKREHYYFDEGMRDCSGKLVDPKKNRAAFLKDVIAMANVARQRGEESYLCLGIEEHDQWTIWGVEGKHPKAKHSPSWEEVEACPDKMNRWVESIQRAYVSFAKEFVDPELPEIHYETGWVKDENGQEHLIGLLVIRPTFPSKGFHLTEDRRKAPKLEELGLRPGYSWRRLGALNDEVQLHQRDSMLKSFQDYPYVPLKGWRVYLEDLSKLDSYYAQKPDKPNIYQPLRSRLDGRPIEDASEFLSEFVRHHNSERILLVVGEPGSGKTTLLERLASNLAREALQAIEATHNQPYIPGVPRALDMPYGAPIPVLVNLWGYRYTEKDPPELRVVREIMRYRETNLTKHEKPFHLLRDPDLCFVVMLDGLDEISHETRRCRERTLYGINRMLLDYPMVRFIITCRTDELDGLGPLWKGYLQLHIEPLDQIQVRQYLSGVGQTSVLRILDESQPFETLLSNPRRIDVLRQSNLTLENAGMMLDSILRGFVDEENKKHAAGHSNLSRVWAKMSAFALWLLETGREVTNEQEARRRLTNSCFDWLFRAGLLRRKQEQIGFSDSIICHYLVAKHLIDVLDNDKRQEINRLLEIASDNRTSWKQSIHLAANLWPRDITLPPIVDFLRLLDPECQLLAICERRESSVSDYRVLRNALDEYLVRSDVDSRIPERLCSDGNRVVQITTAQAISHNKYLPAADALVLMAERASAQRDAELRDVAVQALQSLGDPRYSDFITEATETFVAHEVAELQDQMLSEESISSQVLTKIGGVSNAIQ